MKHHTQATGANAGMIVPCKAEIQCRLALESEHYYFDDADDVKKINELTIARDSGGNFGEGLNSNEEEQLQKLRERARTIASARTSKKQAPMWTEQSDRSMSLPLSQSISLQVAPVQCSEMNVQRHPSRHWRLP